LTCITFVSFIAYAIRNYTLPDQWTYGTVLLRHTVGFVSIILIYYCYNYKNNNKIKKENNIYKIFISYIIEINI